MYKKSNFGLIHTFIESCALLFFKGVLLKDKKGILIQQTENVQAARQLRFTNVKEIAKLKKLITDYILEACEVEESGVKVEMKKTKDYKMPVELQQQLDKQPKIKKAIEALTQGRKRAYLFYLSQAKQSKTRIARVEKYTQQILLGKGLDD